MKSLSALPCGNIYQYLREMNVSQVNQQLCGQIINRRINALHCINVRVLSWILKISFWLKLYYFILLVYYLKPVKISSYLGNQGFVLFLHYISLNFRRFRKTKLTTLRHFSIILENNKNWNIDIELSIFINNKLHLRNQ